MKDRKFVILGVAFDWETRKGLDVFIDLAKKLDNDYQIVLVGTDDCIDQGLPGNIISIHRTGNQEELAEVYSMADLFLNPTREENYPTVNIEALACGTPVLTFNTGGSPEIIDDHSGEVVSSGEVKETLNRIIEIRKTGKFSQSDCVRRAGELERKLKFREYVNLYREVCGGAERNA